MLKAWEVISGVPGQLPDELDHKQAVNIGGKSFFRYSGNPDDYN
ncbi:MAG: hypothetical protein PQJ50_11860 [Spirochaetales bacterium]|nr:hypothetical protein [Spirochaetales bacterium]